MMHSPPHPGEVLKDEVIAPLGLSVTAAALRLGMSRVALSHVLNGKAGIIAELAVRLEKAGTGSARSWITMQGNYDLWNAMQIEHPPIRAFQDIA